MTAARMFGQHFSSIKAEDLPGDGLAEMRRLLLDYCGVGLAGSRTDTGRIVADLVVETGGAPQSTVLGRAARIPAMHAAFANAVAEHSIELDDVDDEALFHYGPPVISAALAVAEWQHATGTELLAAAFLGCEMTNRLSRATNPALRNRGFHTTPACGVFGAAAAAGRLLGLDAAQMTSALGLAGAQASGLMEMYGPSMQKRINPGPAARNGVTAALLAKRGFTGADTIFEGERGFGAAFSGHLDRDALLGGLGREFPVAVEYKPYSAARPIHNAIDCALQIRQADGFDPADVAAIVVRRHPAWAEYHLNPAPGTYHEAQVSLPYSVAVALVDGLALPGQYADDQLARPELVALSQRVQVIKDPTLPRGVSCHMSLTTRDGGSIEVQVDDPRGSLRNPMTDEDLGRKFAMLAGPVIGDGPSRQMTEVIDHIDEVTDVSVLLELAVPQGS